MMQKGAVNMAQKPRKSGKIVMSTLVDPSVKKGIDDKAKQNFQSAAKHIEWLLTKYVDGKINIKE
jgi:hypothetical protein